MPAEFLVNLPKNLTTHLTHKLCAVLPKCIKQSEVIWKQTIYASAADRQVSLRH